MIEKIWLVTQESNVDGQILFNVVPCINKETAFAIMNKEAEILVNESPKYIDAKKWILNEGNLDFDECPYTWDIDDNSFYLSCCYDNYYEIIKIEEKAIQY